MMRNYYKQCKNTKEVNSFLKSINLKNWYFDLEYTFNEFDMREFDHDAWEDEKETKGLSLRITNRYEVFVTKYTKKDLEELEQADNQ